MPYNYDPSRYVTDFSWIGDIGKAISSTALKMPELIELNKQIKENNKFKEMTYDAANKFIDQMDIEDMSNILSAMGMSKDVEGGEQNARNKLKTMIPKYADKSSNQEYAKEITNSFFVPFMQAAQSDAGGGILSFGKLFGSLQSGELQEAIRGSSVGREAVARELEQKAYEKGLEREEEKYKTGFERQHGFQPIPGTGEKETAFKQEQMFKGEAEKQQYQTRQERSAAIAEQTANIVTNAESSMDVWNEDKFSGVPAEARQKAFEVWRQRESDALKVQLAAMDDTIQTAKAKKDKPVDANVISNSLNTAFGLLSRANNALADLKDKDNNIKNRESLVAIKKYEIKQLTDRINFLSKVETIFPVAGEMTTKGLAGAYKKAGEELSAEREQQKRSLVDSYNAGKYKKWHKSLKAEQNAFVEDFKSTFGEDVQFDESGKAIYRAGQKPGFYGYSGDKTAGIGEKSTAKQSTFEDRKSIVLDAFGAQYDKILQQNPNYTEEQIIEELYQKLQKR